MTAAKRTIRIGDSPADALGGAIALLAHQGTWCRTGPDDGHAWDARGVAVPAESPKAVRFTILGALALTSADERVYLDACKAVSVLTGRKMLLSDWQDRAGWALAIRVMQIAQRALLAASVENASSSASPPSPSEEASHARSA